VREDLAEKLLARVMQWAAPDIARERPALQALATYKYDEYQQFSPGMRFVESLAIWLEQFKTIDERRVAYDFVRSRLIFFSSSEMNHLVSVAYRDHLRPMLLRQTAAQLGLSEHRVVRAARSREFQILQRRCLFLGLSDGARIDVFRRSNTELGLTHEQILRSYEISKGRVDEALVKLRKSIEKINDGTCPDGLGKFGTLVLLDDFSGSGYSYLRESGGEFDGKIAELQRAVIGGEASRLVDLKGTRVVVVLYAATSKARARLDELLPKLWGASGVESSVVVVHELGPEVAVLRSAGGALGALIEKYYDSSVEDEHTRKGGKDVKYGFGECGLPLVLSHNTPNNSLALLWAESPPTRRALFARVSRHRRGG
jgi:hypothetical protein